MFDDILEPNIGNLEKIENDENIYDSAMENIKKILKEMNEC